ncbi:MAG: hypothetical protein LBL58_10140, partial [Tannerellaceae bacterium]|nr:hypothetical protein [Tannerellaceae bacterium]
MNKIYWIALLFISLSCSKTVVEVENERYGTLVATHQLELVSEKKIAIDEVTAPGAIYMQMITNPENSRF